MQNIQDIATTPIINTVRQGNCIDLMAQMPARTVDFILTDPPYIANYRSRDGHTVRNDDNDAWLKPAFAQMFRVLKPDSFAISFYGWPKADLFFDAWKSAGFRIAGHMIFRKGYTSKSAFLQYQHEQAFLLVKGNPAYPDNPLPDVIDMPYSGNKFHPTQKPVAILKPLIDRFSKPGDLVLDPFTGSGSTLVAAQVTGRNYLGMELDRIHHATARARLVRNMARRAAA